MQANVPTHCGLCGKTLAVGGGFIVRIEIFADPRLPQMTGGEVESLNFDQTLSQLLKQIEGIRR